MWLSICLDLLVNQELSQSNKTNLEPSSKYVWLSISFTWLISATCNQYLHSAQVKGAILLGSFNFAPSLISNRARYLHNAQRA